MVQHQLALPTLDAAQMFFFSAGLGLVQPESWLAGPGSARPGAGRALLTASHLHFELQVANDQSCYRHLQLLRGR